jgi:hypothetical protein
MLDPETLVRTTTDACVGERRHRTRLGNERPAEEPLHYKAFRAGSDHRGNSTLMNAGSIAVQKSTDTPGLPRVVKKKPRVAERGF